jgi:hypothetical protein
MNDPLDQQYMMSNTKGEEGFRKLICPFSVVENMTANATVEVEKCKVQNLSCVTFPTTAQCSGIAMGGCMCKLILSIFLGGLIHFQLCYSGSK